MSVDDWRDIPGYGGAYQISFEGEVRSWRWRKERFAAKPRMLVPYMMHSGKQGKARYVKLTDAEGKSKEVKIMSLMVEVWMGGHRPGKVPYHKNGDLTDNCVNNIGFATRRELGKMSGAKGKRMAVQKIAPDGEVVEVYSSARAAAKANHMSYQTVIDRCRGRVKNPFALDGYNYQYDV